LKDLVENVVVLDFVSHLRDCIGERQITWSQMLIKGNCRNLGNSDARAAASFMPVSSNFPLFTLVLYRGPAAMRC
jgi:hypothetical protein